MKKTGGRKSRDTLPLRNQLLALFLVITYRQRVEEIILNPDPHLDESEPHLDYSDPHLDDPDLHVDDPDPQHGLFRCVEPPLSACLTSKLSRII